MATFPVLKTGAVAQYPLDYESGHSTQSVLFLDGSRQTFRLYPGALRRWNIQLDELDEGEMDSVISFAEAQGGATFLFPDPITGSTVPNCVIAGDQLNAEMALDLVGSTSLVIEELA